MKEDSSFFFFARQPILNRNGEIAAYELLYRSGSFNSAGEAPHNATAQVVINALNLTGLTNLLQKDSKAFINIDENMLFNDTLQTVPKEHFILELLEDINISPKITERVKELHEAGFHFALDDVLCNKDVFSSIQPLLPYVDIIKLELPQSLEDVEKYMKVFKKMGLTVLAEKVETDECYQKMHELGCDLFQGYYFAKPTIISGAKIDTKLALLFHVISLLSQGETDEALDVFKQDAALTIQLLRYMNSAAFSFRSEIKSIQHAMTLLGVNHLKQWLTLMSYAMGKGQGMHSPLLKQAQERANMMKLLAKECIDKNAEDDAAFIGLLSLMDALFQRPLDVLLAELNIDSQIQNVLLHFNGILGQLYRLVLSVETFHDEEIKTLLSDLGLNAYTFADIIKESYRLTEEFNNKMTQSNF